MLNLTYVFLCKGPVECVSFFALGVRLARTNFSAGDGSVVPATMSFHKMRAHIHCFFFRTLFVVAMLFVASAIFPLLLTSDVLNSSLLS